MAKHPNLPREGGRYEAGKDGESRLVERTDDAPAAPARKPAKPAASAAGAKSPTKSDTRE